MANIPYSAVYPEDALLEVLFSGCDGGTITLYLMVVDRITRNPEVMGGKPCVRGIRVTVGMIVGLVAAGRTNSEILAAYPYLEDEDIRQALAYAAWRVEEIEIPLPAA